MTREVRIDPFTGDVVVLSTERVVERPAAVRETDPLDCPFCPGREHHTPPTIQAIERDGGWVARAFANRHPMLVVEERSAAARHGPFETHAGVGAHEVLVESPEHAPLHHQPVARTLDALRLAVSRLRDLRQDRRLVALQWFRNQGVGAGASQAHPHAQIVGLPVVPRRLREATERARDYAAREGRSLYDAVRRSEEQDGRRLIVRHDPVLVVCPFAPRSPFEVWLLPEEPGARFSDARPEELDAVARSLVQVTAAWERVLGPVAYTVAAHGAPEDEDGRGVGWYVSLAPKLVVPAGLESATGVAVHAVFPEEAAAVLRQAVERTPSPVP